MIVEQTIIGVTKRNITTKDNRPMTIYDIETAEGTKWSTTKDDLALEAHSHVGRLVAIDGTIKQNGKYKNYYLNGIMDPGDHNETITDMTAIANGLPEKLSYIERAQKSWPTVDTPERPDERQESIYRQVAAKVAASMSGTPAEFWQNVEILIQFFRTGIIPDQEQPNQFIPEGAVAAGVGNGYSGSTVDDDLPF